jgi:hypothetical protein
LSAGFSYRAYVWHNRHKDAQIKGGLYELNRTDKKSSLYERLSQGASLTAVMLSFLGLIATATYTVKNHQLSDLQNISRAALAKTAQSAAGKAEQATNDLNAAKNRLNATETELKNTEADLKNADLELVDAKTRLRIIENERAPRVLTKKQRDTLFSLLKLEAPQELYLVSALDQESRNFSNMLMAVLTEAGWKVVPHPPNWGTIESYPDGLELLVPDVTKPVSRGGAQLSCKRV